MFKSKSLSFFVMSLALGGCQNQLNADLINQLNKEIEIKVKVQPTIEVSASPTLNQSLFPKTLKRLENEWIAPKVSLSPISL